MRRTFLTLLKLPCDITTTGLMPLFQVALTHGSLNVIIGANPHSTILAFHLYRLYRRFIIILINDDTDFIIYQLRVRNKCNKNINKKLIT